MEMTLEPGETFEHAHQSDSITTLVEGTVDLIVNGSRRALEIGAPTRLAANVSHILVNTGLTRAKVRCIHPAELASR